MISVSRLLIACCVALMSVRGYAEEWSAPVVLVEPTANGWTSGENAAVQWTFDLCNDGEVSAQRIVGDSSPGGDGECVEIACENSPRHWLFFRATDLTIPEGTQWISVWIKGVKGRAERLEGSFHVVDSQGILNGTVLSLAQPVEIQGDSIWKQYVFRIPPLEKGVRQWGYDPLSEVHGIAWPLKTVATGWRLEGQGVVFRMDDWGAGVGKPPEGSLAYTLDPAKPRALSPEETVETWFNAWINRDPDMVLLYNAARFPSDRRQELMDRYHSTVFPLLMSDSHHVVGILEMERQSKRDNTDGDVVVEVVVRTFGGWAGSRKRGGNYFKTRWHSHGPADPWYLSGGF